MKHTFLLPFAFFSLSLLAVRPGTSHKYDFFKPYLDKLPAIPIETPSHHRRRDSRPVDVNLQKTYAHLKRSGTVKIFMGIGYTHEIETIARLKNLMTAINTKLSLGLIGLKAEGDRLTFEKQGEGVIYAVDYGYERNQFANAFGSYGIVSYIGHSRYGRGPAFQNFFNYFRMGDVFKTIEVDTRNPYFANEPLQLTDLYKPSEVTLDNKTYSYQYRGQKEESSFLPNDSYTINIPGGAKDLEAAKFLNDNQLFFLCSCENENYWKNPFRKIYPDPSEKLVYGTFADAGCSAELFAIFLASVVKETPSSAAVVTELNQAQNVFTAY